MMFKSNIDLSGIAVDALECNGVWEKLKCTRRVCRNKKAVVPSILSKPSRRRIFVS